MTTTKHSQGDGCADANDATWYEHERDTYMAPPTDARPTDGKGQPVHDVTVYPWNKR